MSEHAESLMKSSWLQVSNLLKLGKERCVAKVNNNEQLKLLKSVLHAKGIMIFNMPRGWIYLYTCSPEETHVNRQLYIHLNGLDAQKWVFMCADAPVKYLQVHLDAHWKFGPYCRIWWKTQVLLALCLLILKRALYTLNTLYVSSTKHLTYQFEGDLRLEEVWCAVWKTDYTYLKLFDIRCYRINFSETVWGDMCVKNVCQWVHRDTEGWPPGWKLHPGC